MRFVTKSSSSPVRSVCAAAIVLCWCSTAFASSYAEVQVWGLKALYNSTNGQEWNTSTGWRDSLTDVCNWYGVVCDSSSGNVTSLLLSSNGLVGDVSEATELINLSSLKELDLSDNQLSGSVPLMLGLMPSLEKLDISGNELSSFPASWGSAASRLRHMSLQNNRISGSLPAAWVELSETVRSAYPPVFLQSTSSWMPELRSLLLGGNNISGTGYAALQTVANWKSLQTLDLSNNALVGSVGDALDTYIYCDGSGGAGCGGNMSSVAAPLLRVLKLDGNELTGQLPQIVGISDRRIDVFDISDNIDITGAVPASYSGLLMLFAERTNLSGSDLPLLVDATSTTSAGAWPQESRMHNLSVCPAFQPSRDEDVVLVTLDPAYDGYSVCTCNDGFEGSGESCSECPLGSYRSKEDNGELLGETGTCLVCPPSSTTLQRGRWLKSQCLCSRNFYDQQGGVGSGPSCIECPSGSRTKTAGAINITSCECGPGDIFNTTSGVCEGCLAGTYKPAYGNQVGLCLPCPAGFFSEAIGATSQSDCEACPLGFYGESTGASSVASCAECPGGTYGSVQGLSSASLCTACWPGFYSESVGASSYATCIECPSNHSQPIAGAASQWDCIPCSDDQVANRGSSECTEEFSDDGTLIGLYLLIAGIILVVFTIIGVFLQKHCGDSIPVREKVHMKLNEEMKKFIFGQQFWISIFSGVEIMDLMSDLGAYASLLYTAALTGAMKVLYTIVVAFALVASLHGVHTRAMIILDMQEERTHGLAITGNNMLYYEKQFTLLQIMSQKRTCRIHVPFDRGNKYLSHHIGVQRLISLNSMRIIIAIFEDVPFLSLNMFLLMTQPDLASNLVFMMSFVMSIFVLGYKMTLLEKHARLQIRKWNLEARMDTDTMLNKKAARGRRFSWACQQCEDDGIFPEAQKDMSRTASQSHGGVGRVTHPRGSVKGSSPVRSKRGTAPPIAELNNSNNNNSDAMSKRANDSAGSKAAPAHLTKSTEAPTTTIPGGDGVDKHGQQPGGEADGAPNSGNSSIAWRVFRGSTSGTPGGTPGGKGGDNRKDKRRGRNRKILPSEGGLGGGAHEGEAVTDPLVLPDQQPSSTEMTAGHGGDQDRERVLALPEREGRRVTADKRERLG